jgi:hypothetical protein
MNNVTIGQIDERLRQLPPEELSVEYDFVSYLADRGAERTLTPCSSEALPLMIASESVLGQDWDRPEEDVTWADLER